MTKLKKINLLSFAKLLTVMGALIVLILGILYTFGGLLIDIMVTMAWITPHETPGLSYGSLLAFGAIIGMPLIFALFGLVLGFIGAILYNLFAKWFGGIKVEF